jgi:uncharacterized protein (AIM24 family)
VEYGRRTKAKTVLATQGPIEELTRNNGCVVADGNYVVGRTSGMKFAVRRDARSRLSQYLSGESYARVFERTGKLLMCCTPYWRFRLSSHEIKDPILAD